MSELAVPQLGEGLREVRIVEILRRAGDAVKRGEPLYVVETDKSTVELEAPADAVIERWTVSPGDVVAVGAVVAQLARPADAAASPPAPAAAVPVPPRTRAHARTLGIDDAMLARIPAAGSKLLPADIDAWLARPTPGAAPAGADEAVSADQRRLVYRLRRSAELVIPGTIALDLRWSALARRPAADPAAKPSPVQALAHAAACVAARLPRMRSTMTGDERMRTWPSINVGIALARPGDELVTAVVRAADTLDISGFVREARRRMREALRSGDQAGEDTQLLVSHLGAEGIVDAVPVLVAPANTILFLGAPRADGLARLVCTFDHRLHNGAGAATFVAGVRRALEGD